MSCELKGCLCVFSLDSAGNWCCDVTLTGNCTVAHCLCVCCVFIFMMTLLLWTLPLSALSSLSNPIVKKCLSLSGSQVSLGLWRVIPPVPETAASDDVLCFILHNGHGHHFNESVHRYGNGSVCFLLFMMWGFSQWHLPRVSEYFFLCLCRFFQLFQYVWKEEEEAGNIGPF